VHSWYGAGHNEEAFAALLRPGDQDNGCSRRAGVKQQSVVLERPARPRKGFQGTPVIRFAMTFHFNATHERV
jgi:hypothetical protein